MIQKSLAEISDNQAEATVIATLLAHPHMMSTSTSHCAQGIFMSKIIAVSSGRSVNYIIEGLRISTLSISAI